MAILGRLKRTLGMGNEEELHEYRCSACHTTFESVKPSANAASCTACGATDVSSIDG